MKKTFLVCGLVATFLLSCTIDGTNWDMDVTAPVVETKLDLTNLIGADNLSIDPDSAVNVAVDAALYTFSFDTLTNLPTGTNVYTYVWAGPNVTLPSGVSLLGQTSSLEMDYNTIRLS